MRVKLHTTDVGIPNCWFSIDRKHASVSDLISAIRSEFELPEIQLEMDGFLLLESGTTMDLLRENDLIYVLPISRKRIKTDHIIVGNAKAQDSKETMTAMTDVSKVSSAKDASSDSSSGSSDETSSGEDSEADAQKESEDSSESGETDSSSDSSSDSAEEAIILDETVPPVMTSFMVPPMSLVGRNKRKIVPKMLEQERVHVHFDALEDEVDQSQTMEKVDDNVIFSTVRLYDDEPQKEVLSASQKRRLRRKKAAIYKTLESLTEIKDDDSKEKDDQGTVSYITSIADLRDGMKIAYQILEMSQNYQPEISKYREALVVEVDTMNKAVILKNTGIAEKNVSDQENEVPLRKFELPPDDDYAPEDTQEDIYRFNFNDLISIKKVE